MIPVWWQNRRALHHSLFAEFHREGNECTNVAVISSVLCKIIERQLGVPKIRFNKMERGLLYHCCNFILNSQFCNQKKNN